MPAYSRFYSATEAEASSHLVQLLSRRPDDVSQFSSDDAKYLANLLNSTVTSRLRARKDVDQPLFRPEPPIQSVEELLNASTFSIAQEIVYRKKPVNYESTSDESHVWNIRSRTPSSHEQSPQKHRLPSPTLSIKAEVSSASDESEDGLAQMIEPGRQTHIKSWAARTDYHATYPRDVLQTMDTQFSKWSYDLNEGRTSIPFVMAQAPSETHERLVGIDRKLWTISGEDLAEEVANSQEVAKEVLERVQQKASKLLSSNKVPKLAKCSSQSSVDLAMKDKSTSKRAALIAKSKAARDSSLVASKSAGQRRSALQKNKHRRSIMPSPPPTARKAEPARKPETEAEQPKPTILILNSEEDDQRRNVDAALQNRSIDFEDSQQLKKLMQQLGKTKTEASEGQIIGEIQDTDHENGREQAGRRKGKARRIAKSNAAR